MLFTFLNFDDNLTFLNQMARLLFNCNYSLHSSIFTLSFGKNKLLEIYSYDFDFQKQIFLIIID